MTSPPTHEERLHTNYSSVGVAVMQALYSDDYLSVGGTASTDELAQLAGVNQDTSILDIGCGVGGPMLHVAATFGCRVVGIDLVETSVEQARLRSTELGLNQFATFHHGNATTLPFGDGSFDVIWGQDAWCHVPDKPALLAEAGRVLRPGGAIVFTDWLAGAGLTPALRQVALEAALSEHAATGPQYVDLLGDAGFIDIDYVDIGPVLLDQYREICARLEANRDDLCDRFSDRVYSIVAETNTTVLRGFEGGAIGGGRFLARRPATEASQGPRTSDR